MPDELKPVLARQMEVFAGFLEHTDHNVGRVIDALEDLEILDDTIIYYIIGDNGASAEGTMNGAFNELANFNGMAALETPEFMQQQDGRVRLAELVQPLLGRLGVGDQHPVPVDQAGRLALGRHPQRHDRPLAQRDRGEGWPALPVHPRHRRRPDDPRGRRPARADHGQRRAAVADGRHQHAVQLQRRRRAGAARPAVLRDVRQPRHLPQGLERGHQAPHAMGDGRRRSSPPSTTTCGSSTTATSTTARPTTSSPSTPRCWPSCNGCGSSKPPSTTCCRWTTAPPSGSCRRWPDVRRSSAATRSCSSPAWDGSRRTASSASRTSRSPSPPTSTSPTAAPTA